MAKVRVCVIVSAFLQTLNGIDRSAVYWKCGLKEHSLLGTNINLIIELKELNVEEIHIVLVSCEGYTLLYKGLGA